MDPASHGLAFFRKLVQERNPLEIKQSPISSSSAFLWPGSLNSTLTAVKLRVGHTETGLLGKGTESLRNGYVLAG